MPITNISPVVDTLTLNGSRISFILYIFVDHITSVLSVESVYFDINKLLTVPFNCTVFARISLLS